MSENQPLLQPRVAVVDNSQKSIAGEEPSSVCFEPSTCEADRGFGDHFPPRKGCWSILFFSWVRPILKVGNQRPLEPEDLYQLEPWNHASELASRFQKHWQQETFKTKPSLVWALTKAFGGQVLAAGALLFIQDALKFVSPMIIKSIIAFLSDPTATTEQGMVYVAIVFATGVIQSFALRQYFFSCFEAGMRLRSAICMAVYQKSLRLSSSARQKKTTGEILNLMSIDAQRLQDLTLDLHDSWDTVLQIVVCCYLLWGQIGVATLAGVAVILLLVPMMSCISKLMRNLQSKLMNVKDERIKVCHEVLSGIKGIKLQAWENSFIQRVMEYRAQELRRLRTYILAQSCSTTIFNIEPTLVTVMSFYAYALLGNVLDVGTALTSLALFNILRFPLFMLPQLINILVEASVSVGRLEKFLLADECKKVGHGSLQEVGVLMEDADFRWSAASDPDDKNEQNDEFSASKELLASADHDASTSQISVSDKATVRNVSFSGECRQLIAIVGPVGSGKSTLLAGLLGDADIVKGHVAIRGSVAYVAQKPFIMNATVRDNISFGLPFDRKRYDEAIRVSCLKKDLSVLPGGDLTEIGEKGINLSGGQRTRVAIARAVYQDADVYILDDILSAVDSHVGSDIFTKCIKTCLKSKLVLLVTHSLSFLSQCDRVIVMDQGEIAEQGSFEEVMGRGRMLRKMVSNYEEKQEKSQQEEGSDGGVADDERDGDGACTDDLTCIASVPPVLCDSMPLVSPVDDGNAVSQFTRPLRTSSFVSDVSEDGMGAGSGVNPNANANNAQLMTSEDRSTGDVAWSVYRAWIEAFGGMGAYSLVVFGYVVAQMITLLSTFWISYWSEHAHTYPQNQMFYVYVFMAINGAYAVVLFIRTLLMYVGGLRASRILFVEILSRVLRAPISFFDTTPLGRIVNRLSKDVYTMDENIPRTWHMLLSTLVTVVVTIGTILYVTPYFMVILVPVMVVYYMTQQYFIKTSRELQRLDSITRSPIFALLAETLDGISTIRAYNVESDFVHRNECLLDKNQRAYFLNFSINCWLGLHLQFVGTIIASAATLMGVLAHESSSPAFAGMVGVSLTYAFNCTMPLHWTVRMVSQLQTQMVSIERIKHYSEMPTEPPLLSEPETKPAYDWPQRGQITFQNVSLRYRPGLPRVLRNLSFTVKPREKIGIVGRTGAGKSSLIVALMRLTELDSGVIKIDGVDISTIGLHDLRGKISIIPQDPVLFSGSVRANLDPFDQFSDDQIWTSIKRAHLQNAVTALDEKVDEQGSNFSVGERQLLCIARALLRRSRVILMDEATASIDTETDRKIQQSIREEFKDCTCLTVAHRINTILDSDRVLVMDKGAVAEFDTPKALQKNPKGIFKSLVDHWRQESK